MKQVRFFMEDLVINFNWAFHSKHIQKFDITQAEMQQFTRRITQENRTIQYIQKRTGRSRGRIKASCIIAANVGRSVAAGHLWKLYPNLHVLNYFQRRGVVKAASEGIHMISTWLDQQRRLVAMSDGGFSFVRRNDFEFETRSRFCRRFHIGLGRRILASVHQLFKK